MKIKCMLIKNGYSKAYLDRCIMKYLSKKHEVPINSLTKKTPEANFIFRMMAYGKAETSNKSCIQ